MRFFICFVLVSIFTWWMPAHSANEDATNKLPDGIYLIERSASKRESLYELSCTECILVDDGRFLEPGERDQVSYLVLDCKDSVPFKLSNKPIEDNEQSTGKPRLQIQFATAQTKALKVLTENNVGKRTAIVIDGQVVTCHKIREAIRGGRLQITRCTKHHCDLIYSKLIKDK